MRVNEGDTRLHPSLSRQMGKHQPPEQTAMANLTSDAFGFPWEIGQVFGDQICHLVTLMGRRDIDLQLQALQGVISVTSIEEMSDASQ